MRINTSLKRLIFCVVVSTSLIFSSCIDDSVDLDNLSDDISIGGDIGLPLANISLRLQDMLDKYEPSVDSEFKVGVENGVVCLFYDKVIDYETPDLTSDFEDLKLEIENFVDISQIMDPFAFLTTLPADTHETGESTFSFDFNNINADDSKQRVDSIRFIKTGFKITVESDIDFQTDDVLVLNIQIPGTEEYIDFKMKEGKTTTETLFYENLSMILFKNGAKNNDYKVKYTIAGDGKTGLPASKTINLKIEKETNANSEFFVYGYFDYTNFLDKEELYQVDLFNYLPEGNALFFENPSFEFNIESSIGVPLEFNLKSLTAKLHNNTHPTVFNKSIDIDPATTEGSFTTTAPIIIDRDNSPGGEISNLFNTELESINANYVFSGGTPTGDASNTPMFIWSKSKVRVNANAKIPLHFAGGTHLAYNDTILDIDLAEDNIKEATIILSYENQFPFSLLLELEMLDENYNPIQSLPAEDYYQIKSAPINSDGAATGVTKDRFEVKYKTQSIEAKHLVVKIKGEAFDASSKIKFEENNTLKVKIGASTNVGIEL